MSRLHRPAPAPLRRPHPDGRTGRELPVALLLVLAPLVLSLLLGALPATAATAPAGTVAHGFETGREGWSGDGAGHSTAVAAAGTGSLRLGRTFSGGWGGLRADDGRGALRDVRAGGTTLTARVLVPSGTAGAWRARLEVQDPAWRYVAGPKVPLTAGTWTPVTFTVPDALAAGMRAVAVQVDSDAATGAVVVHVDEVRQQAPAVTSPTPPATPAPTGAPRGLRAVGSRVVDETGRTVRLLGVNTAGTEYACAQGWGFFDGPDPERPSSVPLAGARAWGATAVRVPLNEHCWLDVDSGIPASRRGSEYRDAVTRHVAAVNAAGMVAVLDLHWHAPGTRRTDNNPMPNRDHSPAFWSSVAAHFRDNPSVVFELVNEPHPDAGSTSAEAWRCWRDGGTCARTTDHATGAPYRAAGVQELLDAVRATGARQLVLVGGVQWSNRLDGWLAHRPHDPVGNLGAAWHAYDFNACRTAECFAAEVAPVAARHPLVATEIGPDQACLGCPPSPTGFSERVLDLLDGAGAGWTAWTWNLWPGDAHVLVHDWAGTRPTPWGEQVRARLQRAAAAG